MQLLLEDTEDSRSDIRTPHHAQKCDTSWWPTACLGVSQQEESSVVVHSVSTVKTVSKDIDLGTFHLANFAPVKIQRILTRSLMLFRAL